MTSLRDVYEFNLASSGKLKLRAKARLAEGDPAAMFEACVLLHEAARIERRAIDALPTCPATTRLSASIEECWCLIEGRDPPSAADVWGRILREKRDVEDATAQALLSRLAPRYEQSFREFVAIIGSSTTLLKLHKAGAIVPTSATERASALREVRRVLSAFPGIPSFWWMAYRLAEAGGDLATAWDALSRARLLTPENKRFHSMSLLLSVQALTTDEADEYIGGVRSSLDKAGAEVCLMYALAEIELARHKGSRDRWLRAREATAAGLVQARSQGLQKNLYATQLILDSLLGGKEPTLEILYMAGLGELAATAPPNSHVVDVVASMASRRVRAMESFDAAA